MKFKAVYDDIWWAFLCCNRVTYEGIFKADKLLKKDVELIRFDFFNGKLIEEIEFWGSVNFITQLSILIDKVEETFKVKIFED